MTAPSPSLGSRQLQPRTNPTQPLQDGPGYELFKIESTKLPELKAELNLAHKDLPSLTLEDKASHIHLKSCMN